MAKGDFGGKTDREVVRDQMDEMCEIAGGGRDLGWRSICGGGGKNTLVFWGGLSENGGKEK